MAAPHKVTRTERRRNHFVRFLAWAVVQTGWGVDFPIHLSFWFVFCRPGRNRCGSPRDCCSQSTHIMISDHKLHIKYQR